MRKIFTLLLALLALSVGAWAVNIEWNTAAVQSVSVSQYHGQDEPRSQTINGITVTATATGDTDYSGFNTYEGTTSISSDNDGTLTFATTLGVLTGIIIHVDETDGSVYGFGEGWNDDTEHALTWTGNAASVVLGNDGSQYGASIYKITSIDFTVASVPASTSWNAEALATISLYTSDGYYSPATASVNGITITGVSQESGDYCNFSTYQGNTSISIDNGSTLTFSSPFGNLASIVIHYDETNGYAYNFGEGWNKSDDDHTLSWTGNAASVVLGNDGGQYGASIYKIISIDFEFAAAAPADPEPAAPVTLNITWDSEYIASIDITEYTNFQTIGSYNDGTKVASHEHVTATVAATADGSYAGWYTYEGNTSFTLQGGGTLTFSSDLGQLTEIVINIDPDYTYGFYFDGWNWDNDNKKLTWTGDASSVVFDSEGEQYGIRVSDIDSINFTVVSGAAPATQPTDIEWDETEISGLSLSCDNVGDTDTADPIDGITLSLEKTSDSYYCELNGSSTSERFLCLYDGCGEATFTSSVGNITDIVITCSDVVSCTDARLSEGWTYDSGAATLTWSGTPSTAVTLSSESGYTLSITISSIVFTVEQAAAPVDPTPSGPTITWAQRQIDLVSMYCTSSYPNYSTGVIKNIIASLEKTNDNADHCNFSDRRIKLDDCGELTFKSIAGEISKIVITHGYVFNMDNLSAGWTYDSDERTLTWEGTPAEQVVLSGNVDATSVSSIVFSYTPAAAPRLGEHFYDEAYQEYEITGAHTAKMPVQYCSHTLTIPASYEYEGVTYYITEIAENAFKDNGMLPNIYGGKNISIIGAHAFENCSRMEEFYMDSEVIDSIGDEAFKNNKLLMWFKTYTLVPPILGSNVFTGDNYLNHIQVSGSVTDYQEADNWSDYASAIEEMYSDPSIGQEFFYHAQMTTGLYAVKSVSPKEAKVIPYTAEINALFPVTFEGTLIIPEEVNYMNSGYSVTGIGANAYKDSTRFNTVLMPLAVKTIEAGAFRNCTGVEKVYFLWDDPTQVTWADANQGLDFKTAADGGTQIFVPKDRLEAYKTWAPAWANCMIGGDVLDVTAAADPEEWHARFYRTFYDSANDYMMPAGVWAFAGYVNNGNFILHSVAFDGQILPRGTAVVLESENQNYRLIPMGNDAQLYTGPNDLEGLDENTATSVVAANHGVSTQNIYVLGTQATIGGNLQVGMGMYRYTGETLGANKAYLIYTGTGSGSSDQQTAPVRFLFQREQTPTGIEDAPTDNASCTKVIENGQLIIIRNNVRYNAQGQVIQ